MTGFDATIASIKRDRMGSMMIVAVGAGSVLIQVGKAEHLKVKQSEATAFRK